MAGLKSYDVVETGLSGASRKRDLQSLPLHPPNNTDWLYVLAQQGPIPKPSGNRSAACEAHGTGGTILRNTLTPNTRTKAEKLQSAIAALKEEIDEKLGLVANARMLLNKHRKRKTPLKKEDKAMYLRIMAISCRNHKMLGEMENRLRSG